jgi:hypothetical protein
MRAWLLLITTIALGPAYAIEQPSTNEPVKDETPQQNTGAKPNQSPAAIDDPKSHQETAKPYKPDCAEPNNEGEANFCNLQRQARAAEALNDITASQVLWSKLSAYGLLVTVIFTAIAAFSAARSTKLAREAIGTGRAWITPAGVSYYESSNTVAGPSKYAKAITFYVVWKNTGNTPAIKAQLSSAHRVILINDACPDDFKTEWAPDEEGAIIGPDMPANAAQGAVGDQDLTDFESSKKKVIVYSAARYFDIFDKRLFRKSEACYEMRMDGWETNSRTGVSKIRIATRSVGHRNTAT